MTLETIRLEGNLLLAMPGMADPRFERSVIYICAHSEEGAMGLIINQEADHITFKELLGQLAIEIVEPLHDVPLHVGGPVEVGRGFVLHSADFVQDTTLIVSETVGLTATVAILKAMAAGTGPRHALLALGYAGWGPGQLEREIHANGWLHVEPDDDLIFGADLMSKWPLAMTKLGIDLSLLSGEAGHA